jgi:hypothetical protein
MLKLEMSSLPMHFPQSIPVYKFALSSFSFFSFLFCSANFVVIEFCLDECKLIGLIGFEPNY